MKLTNEQKIFLSKRRRQVRYWQFVGALLIVIPLGLLAWLYVRMPLLANPFEVASRINSEAIPATSLVLMAAMLPMVVLLCFFLVLVVVIFVFSAFSKEKIYLRIIDSLLDLHDSGD